MHTDENTPKPEGSQWSDDQWAAVVTGGRNVLVAAAAGSGKTAVLVERIIRRISSSADVDRLLVATFTKAAAAEMSERISMALEKELERQPDNEHLRRQLALMGRASITTLHSFCLDVIRRYYHMIGLDPGFRIANETESELLRLDVLDELFEHKYSGTEEGSGAFLRLAERYGGERGDEPLYALVQQLYDFAGSHPWPDHWLRAAAESFCAETIDQLESGVWVERLHGDVALALDGAEGQLTEALRLCALPGGPDPYAATLSEDCAVVAALRDAVETLPWRNWGDLFRAATFGKLKPLRGDGYDKALQEAVKELRDTAKKLVSSLADELFGRTPEQFLEELAELAPLMGELAELVIQFGSRYEEAKRRKGLLDFGDLEHYCLRILRDAASEPGNLIPSSAALEYREHFQEILLDEYQDTNMVQEAIVSLIARDGAGNRFMVGDVKQSIYRFRLAEPNLFLAKYKSYSTRDGSQGAVPEGGGHSDGGLRIDLARNFRSRNEVVDGVNAVFRAIMREQVAEMDYDSRAELVAGAAYPPANPPESCRVEFGILDRGADAAAAEADDSPDHFDESVDAASEADSAEDLKVAQLEARWIAGELRRLADSGFTVYDGKRKTHRPMEWRDVVILLRATRQWAPIIIEELQGMGIPAYAELGSGYFEATEIVTMLSLLRIIDNPYQDIPLAAVLRSPLFGFTAEELAQIRILSPGLPYYEAVLKAAGHDGMENRIKGRLSRFLDQLEKWRDEARGGALAELLWRIYRETGYYEFAGGLPGGVQRQANLRALHDRARQYEATSFRGLFRFLRFIERMRDSGGDLGTARALGEQENVVRIMSIHKSKGLEFPVVFVAGLGKLFNQQDLRSSFLKHKELGFGPRIIDPEDRISYPSLPFLAIRRALRREMLAEEMRILYVALTRPKEKLFLVGTVSDLAKKLQGWHTALNGDGTLNDYVVSSARSFLDWLGPMASSRLLARANRDETADAWVSSPPSPDWRAGSIPASALTGLAAAASEGLLEETFLREERIQGIAGMALLEGAKLDNELERILNWSYPHAETASLAAKTSVTEMKRLLEEPAEDAGQLVGESGDRVEDRNGDAALNERISGGAELSSSSESFSLRLRRPAFMGEKKLTAAERGSASHLLMQHMPLSGHDGVRTVEDVLDHMVQKRLLTRKQADSIDKTSVAAFFEGELGRRLAAAQWIRREVPFSCMLPASRVHGMPLPEGGDEPVMIQGVIDCLFWDEAGLVLLDYKTDRIAGGNWNQAAERHRFQLELYGEAVSAMLGREVDELYVYFLDGGRHVRMK
ncbi:helicase-exonuclease AddAB subunit AddA [Paenibacillus sp. CAU 1782]